METRIINQVKNLKPQERRVTVADIDFFGKILKEARLKIGKTYRQLAKRVGGDAKNISAWETAERFPVEDDLQLIADAYGLELDELKEAFRISKRARQLEVEANNKTPKSTFKKGPDSDVYGLTADAYSGHTNVPFKKKL